MSEVLRGDVCGVSVYLCIWIFHSQSRSMSMSISMPMPMSKFASPCARSIHVHYVRVHARILDAKKPKKMRKAGQIGPSVS